MNGTPRDPPVRQANPRIRWPLGRRDDPSWERGPGTLILDGKTCTALRPNNSVCPECFYIIVCGWKELARRSEVFLRAPYGFFRGFCRLVRFPRATRRGTWATCTGRGTSLGAWAGSVENVHEKVALNPYRLNDRPGTPDAGLARIPVN